MSNRSKVRALRLSPEGHRLFRRLIQWRGAVKKPRAARPARAAVRTMDVPVPPEEPESLDERLAGKLGSKAAAELAILEVREQLGVPTSAPRNVSAALALTKLGVDLGQIARSLTWKEFE